MHPVGMPYYLGCLITTGARYEVTVGMQQPEAPRPGAVLGMVAAHCLNVHYASFMPISRYYEVFRWLPG